MSFIQVMGKSEFKTLVFTLMIKAKIPGRLDFFDILESIRKGSAADIANMLRYEHVCITTDD